MIKGQISDRLKSSRFRLWRRRVSGRIAKHRKLLEQRMKGLDWGSMAMISQGQGSSLRSRQGGVRWG